MIFGIHYKELQPHPKKHFWNELKEGEIMDPTWPDPKTPAKLWYLPDGPFRSHKKRVLVPAVFVCHKQESIFTPSAKDLVDKILALIS